MTHTARPPCAFCSQIAGHRESNAIEAILGSDWSRRPILLESAHAVVMPSIGALSAGHVLVCPRAHIRGTATARTEIAVDIERLTRSSRERLEGLATPIHGFEHGSSLRGPSIACSVEHAHLHLVPADVDIRPQLLTFTTWEDASGSPHDLAQQTSGREYLLYLAPTGERWLAMTDTGFPSQILRRVFADALGMGSQWNWRVHAAEGRMRDTVALFTDPVPGLVSSAHIASC
jgi:ATP adenylyltransferase